MSEEPALVAELSLRAGGTRDGFSVDVAFTLERGVLVLFGPSGAGKTLTLRSLAGLVTPERGRIAIGGEPLFDAAADIDVPVHERRVGYVPQHQALFPFLDVEENVAFALGRKERRRDHPEVRALLDELGIAELRTRRPDSLSGGEKQRVALARALAARPKLLLLDEPFAAIDWEGRKELRGTMRAVIEARSIPAVLVTHDLGDAVEMGDWLLRFETPRGGMGKTSTAGPPREVLGSLLGSAGVNRQ